MYRLMGAHLEQDRILVQHCSDLDLFDDLHAVYPDCPHYCSRRYPYSRCIFCVGSCSVGDQVVVVEAVEYFCPAFLDQDPWVLADEDLWVWADVHSDEDLWVLGVVQAHY